MDYETALQRTMAAAYDCVRAMSLMGEANQLINEALKNCDSLISSDSKELFLQINKSIKDEIHVTNVASESIFNLMKHFISEYPSATPYRTIVVPRGYVSFEDEGRILISIPEPCEHGGYSIWFSKRFVSEDPSDNFLQIRYYPDWKFERVDETIFECHSSGVPHVHCMDVLVARKYPKDIITVEDLHK